MAQATFYFDLGSPYAYLTAERLEATLGEDVSWQPVLLGGLFKLNGRSSWARGDRLSRQSGIEEVERRAAGYGLPPVRWPDPWPDDYLFAMRAATFAFAAGPGREFALRAFRDAFVRGRDLAIPVHVLDAAERVGLDRDEVQASVAEPSVKQALRQATETAHELGVFGVPTIAVGGKLFWGDDRVQDAASFAGEAIP